MAASEWETDRPAARQQYSDDEAGSSPRRRGSSPDDAYTDDESNVDRDDFAAAAAAVEKRGIKKAAELVGPTQFKDLVVPRTKLAEFCAAPWFEEWVKGTFDFRFTTSLRLANDPYAGAWVRFLIGPDDRGQPTYRLCEVLSTFLFTQPSRRSQAYSPTSLQASRRYPKSPTASSRPTLPYSLSFASPRTSGFSECRMSPTLSSPMYVLAPLSSLLKPR